MKLQIKKVSLKNVKKYIPILLFLFIVPIYSHYQQQLPISYFDEFLWVGRSYFFDYYISNDFSHPIWQSYASYDQPKLAEYAYGWWLYPTYLIKKDDEFITNYDSFLIKNNLDKTTRGIDDNSTNLNNEQIKFTYNDRGFLEDYIFKYGPEVAKAIKLIQKARLLNIFLLFGTVIAAYLITSQLLRTEFAVLSTLAYGFNSLLMQTNLKAYSEALFLLTFNTSLLSMILFFTRSKQKKHLLLFALFSGLCMSTKLNGAMLLLSFLINSVVLLIFFTKNRTKNIYGFIKSNFIVISITLITFISINPFIFSNPIRKIHFMFDWRMKTALEQMNSHPEVALTNNTSRLSKIFENFYFSQKMNIFNNLYPFSDQPVSKTYQYSMLGLFAVGIASSFKLSLQGDKKNTILLVSFLTTLSLMTFYLKLDWDRYYVQLVFFLIFFQTLGLYQIFTLIEKIYKQQLIYFKN